MVRLRPDPSLNELTNMFERTTEKGSVWVTLKHCWAKRSPAVSHANATILNARMTALKRRERKDRRKAADADKKPGGAKKSSAAIKTST